MWLVTGEFDGDGENKAPQKTKLLKTNRTYVVGRKDAPLLIRNKTVSAAHGEFVVGDFDPTDPTAVPRLTYKNYKKGFGIPNRLGPDHVHPNTAVEVKDEDDLVVTGKLAGGGLKLKVQWKKICCYSSSPNTDYLNQCAELGINLVHKPSPDVTHHLTLTLDPTPDIAASLISSAELVQPAWLSEVLQHGTALEEQFSLPLTSNYRPGPGANLQPPYNQYTGKIWAPNEERLDMFQRYRFLCVAEKAREVPLDLRHMIEQGKGSIECFDVHQGAEKLHTAIRRGRMKEGKTLVLVGDAALLEPAVGPAGWKELVETAQSRGLKFTATKDLIQTALDVDTSRFDVELPAGSPISATKEIEETPMVEKEPTPPPPTRRRPPRRATSATPAPEEPSQPQPPPQEEPQTAAPVPRRRPPRRAPAAAAAADQSAVGDSSALLSDIPDFTAFSIPSKPVSHSNSGAGLPTPSKRGHLKRRARGASAEPSNPLETLLEGTFEVEDTFKEPPLKKFKALFEASDPDAIGYKGLGESLVEGEESQSGSLGSLPPPRSRKRNGDASQTQTQSMSGVLGGAATGSGLGPVREEEEEETGPTNVPQDDGPGALNVSDAATGKKRRMDEDADEDVVMQDDEQDGRPPAKRRAVEGSQAAPAARGASKPPSARAGSAAPPPAGPSKPKMESKGKKGADAGKPDKDTAFLKALASTKRGKKKEDDFDREFNKLKIAKPAIEERPDPEDEWKLLAEFGDDTGLRGNFMTILEMDVFKERDANRERRVKESANPAWIGKPNFKKFKKKDTRAERPKVDLVVHDQHGSRMDWDEDTTEVRIRDLPKPKAKARARAQAPESDQEETTPPPRKAASRVPSRAGSAGSSTQAPSRKASGQAKKRSQNQSAILEDNEDEDPNEVRGGGGSRVTTQSQSQSQALFLPGDDEDEDEMVVLNTKNARGKTKATQSQSRGKGNGKKVVDDDEDEEDEVMSSYTMQSQSTTVSRAAGRSQKASEGSYGAGKMRYDDDDDSEEEVVFGGFGKGRR